MGVPRHDGDAIESGDLLQDREYVTEHGCCQCLALIGREEGSQSLLRLGQFLHRYQGIAH